MTSGSGLEVPSLHHHCSITTPSLRLHRTITAGSEQSLEGGGTAAAHDEHEESLEDVDATEKASWEVSTSPHRHCTQDIVIPATYTLITYAVCAAGLSLS